MKIIGIRLEFYLLHMSNKVDLSNFLIDFSQRRKGCHFDIVASYSIILPVNLRYKARTIGIFVPEIVNHSR